MNLFQLNLKIKTGFYQNGIPFFLKADQIKYIDNIYTCFLFHRDCKDQKDFGRSREWITAPASVGQFGADAKAIYDR